MVASWESVCHVMWNTWVRFFSEIKYCVGTLIDQVVVHSWTEETLDNSMDCKLSIHSLFWSPEPVNLRKLAYSQADC